MRRQSAGLTDLSLPLCIEGEEVIKRSIIDTTPLVLLNVCPSHGVSLSRASLSIGKYANIVACKATHALRGKRTTKIYTLQPSPHKPEASLQKEGGRFWGGRGWWDVLMDCMHVSCQIDIVPWRKSVVHSN